MLKSNPNCKIDKTKLNSIRAQINGYHPIFVYPGDGYYKGDWKNNKREGFGAKYQRNNLIYNGQWKGNLRHGQGALMKQLPTGYIFRIYIGQYKNDKKHGEGKKFYNNGVYYGWWKNDYRSGFGIMWYNDDTTYLGEWDDDKRSGIGIFYEKSGSRYEGNFLNGKKHGEGIYFHNSTGQIQKGIWENGGCKTSIMFDEFRNQVVRPTPYPIPRSELYHPDKGMHDFFRKYLPIINKPVDIYAGLQCIDIIKKMKEEMEKYVNSLKAKEPQKFD